MSNGQYSLDDIVADAKKIRAKQQLEKQRQTSFQRLDNLGYKKMKIGPTTEVSRFVSKAPISDKGKLFYTMQLRKLKEDAMRSLEKKNAAGLDVSKLIEERDIRRKQVLSDVVKMTEQSNADKVAAENLEKSYTEQLEKKSLQKNKKDAPARPQDTQSKQKDLQATLQKPKKSATSSATKAPSAAKKAMPKSSDAASKS
ncbi:MAG: hypothetical protein IJC83_03125, partial [Oscillospiraceae bacterium]|nr:hypothetical protein [Oscillospiraceae bacterium]